MSGTEQTDGDGNRFELLVQSVTDYAICMLDRDGTVATWNAGARRIKGYRAEDIVGRHFSLFYTAEDRAAGLPARALDTAAREGRFEAEGWRVRQDGTRFWANVVIDPIVDPQRGLIGYAKISRDLSERRAAQEALRQSEDRFRLLVQSVTDYAIYMLDTDGIVSSWNAGAERAKGYAADEIIGQHFSRFYGDEDRQQGLPQQALRTAREQGRFNAEGWRYRKDGTRFWASVVIDPVRDPAGTLIGYAKVTRDLSERREAQIALEKAQQAFFQAQKMEAVGQLTGGLAHDFNNLLTGISGSLELLQARVAQGKFDQIDRYASAAQGAAKRAAALTHRLLAFSRRQTLDSKPTDVNRLVRNMEDLLRRTIGPAAHLEVVEAAGLWNTTIDQNQLENAILNLCINARDAMPDGGRITVETANKWLDQRTGEERDLVPGQYISVCVSDTGAGMTPDVIERAFEPFFTTKPIGQGTGLGLSMVYGFVRQSGGQVRIYSEVGQGTTMCLYLPRHYEVPADESVELPVARREATGSGEIILVIDDEPTVRMLITEVVEQLGYSSIEVADGPTGLKVLQSSTRIDLLVTDVGLPGGINGRQVADAARLLRPRLKVLFITGYAENAAIGNGHLDPGMQVLTKPFALDALAQRMRSMLDG
jgi:PAS domain S-box-containing protein